MCPITCEIMRHPAMLRETGTTFEHRMIHDWVVTQRRRTDPATQERIRNGEIVPNTGLQRAIKNWCEAERKTIVNDRRRQDHEIQQQRQPRQARYGSWEQRDRVHVFVDNSNIFAGLDDRVLDIPRLAAHLKGGCSAEERVVVGSSGEQRHWETWKEVGFSVSRDERRGKEVFVDEALIAQMQRTAARTFPPPGRILVLATGDGNTNHGRATFPEAVAIALAHEWFVCVYTWKAKCNPVYKTLLNQPGFRLKFLDDAPSLWAAR